jgi:hypothetical protein
MVLVFVADATVVIADVPVPGAPLLEIMSMPCEMVAEPATPSRKVVAAVDESVCCANAADGRERAKQAANGTAANGRNIEVDPRTNGRRNSIWVSVAGSQPHSFADYRICDGRTRRSGSTNL